MRKLPVTALTLTHTLVLSLALALVAPLASAQYPNRSIRLVLSTAPGGGADVTARLLQPHLAEALGQSIVIENRPGASGLIAGEYVARQNADGYTFLLDITSHSVNPALYAKLPFVPLVDLVPVTQILQAPNVLVVHPSIPVGSVREFIDYARAQGGRLAYASSGNGSAQHLAAEMFKQRTGIDMVHVPYKGGGPALADVIAGQVPVFFAFLASATSHIKAGKLKPIAVTGAARAASMPELPTIAETGLAGYSIYDFNGLFAPARTAAEPIERMQREVARALARPDVRERLASIGAEPVGSTPVQFEAFLRAQIAQWTRLVREANIKVD